VTAAAWALEAADLVHEAAGLALGERPTRHITSSGEQRLVERAVDAMTRAGHWLAGRCRSLLSRARELWWKIAMDDSRARRWADYRALRLSAGSPLDYEDLRQEARAGLYEAARRWDPSRECFRTYARWWVDALLHAAIDAMRYATVIPERELRAARRGTACPEVMAAAEPAGFVDEDTLPEGPWDPADYHERELLRSAVDALPARERLLMEARLRGESLGAIGQRLGVSKVRAGQIGARVESRLRQQMGGAA
jgi:RNA polymerase sigma factor (sigma-70 family)